MTKSTLQALSITELAKFANAVDYEMKLLQFEIAKRAREEGISEHEVRAQVRLYRKKIWSTDDGKVERGEKPEVLKDIIERVMPDLEGRKLGENPTPD